MIRFLKIALLAALPLVPLQASASEPAALVIDMMGASDPGVEAFDELAPGDELALADDAEIIVLHYKSCKEVHLAGGGVVIGRDDLRINGGEVIGEETVECPSKVRFTEGGGEIGAVVLRSAKDAAIAPRPIFIVKGATRVDVRQDGQVLQSIAFDGAKAYWPADAADLVIGGVYELRLYGQDSEFVTGATVKTRAGPAILRFPD